MWRYISDAANRFATSVWNSLTFVFNLIPAPFVLLSINYKLLTFKNIFAFARAGFGSYSDLKMLANAVLVEKKEEEVASVRPPFGEPARGRHSRPFGSAGLDREDPETSAHDEEKHHKELVQKQKAEMFEVTARGVDKTKFAKDDFAALVRAMGLLKGTNFFSEDEVLKTEQVLFLVEAGDNAELFAKLYLDCVSFAEQYKVDASAVFNDIVKHKQLHLAPASPDTKKGLTAIMRNQKLLILSMSKTMQARINKMLAELLKVLMANTILSADGTVGLPALAAVAINAIQKIIDKINEEDDAKARTETRRRAGDALSDAGSDTDADDILGADEFQVAGIVAQPFFRAFGQDHNRMLPSGTCLPYSAARHRAGPAPCIGDERRRFYPSSAIADGGGWGRHRGDETAADNSPHHAPHDGVGGVSGRCYDSDRHVPASGSRYGVGGGGGGGGGYAPPPHMGGSVERTMTTGMRAQHQSAAAVDSHRVAGALGGVGVPPPGPGFGGGASGGGVGVGVGAGA